MSTLRMHRRYFGLVSRWLAVIATLVPLLLPVLPGEVGSVVARASVASDVFTSELCSVTHATRNDDGKGAPADHHEQHCPLCTAIQHLSSCIAVASPIGLLAVASGTKVPSKKIGTVRSLDLHSPNQPRAPPVRV